MRIGFDATLLYGSYSGVEYAIHHLLQGLAAVDSENEYVIYTDSSYTVEPWWPASFCLSHAGFSGHRRSRRILWQQFWLPRQVKRDRIDVLHGPGYVIPIRCPVPSVVTLYDVIALTHPELCRWSNRLHYGLILPRAIRKATRVVVPSMHVRDEILRQLPGSETKIRVVPLGVNPLFLTGSDSAALQRVREKYQLPESYVLFVGNLEPKKNLTVLVEAFSLLKREHNLPHALLLVGSTRQVPATLRSRIEELNLAAIVRLLDYVAESDLPSIYQGAGAVVLPSLMEGFGLPVLEAMASGTPVVASNRGALPEVVGEAGLVCDPQDTKAIASAIHRVLSEERTRNTLVEKGRERASQFTWHNTAKQMLGIYREALE